MQGHPGKCVGIRGTHALNTPRCGLQTADRTGNPATVLWYSFARVRRRAAGAGGGRRAVRRAAHSTGYVLPAPKTAARGSCAPTANAINLVVVAGAFGFDPRIPQQIASSFCLGLPVEMAAGLVDRFGVSRPAAGPGIPSRCRCRSGMSPRAPVLTRSRSNRKSGVLYASTA